MEPNTRLCKNASNIGCKYVRISYQLEYLKSAKIQKFLPRGIADQMKYVSPIHDDCLQKSLQNLMHFTGSRILDLLIIYYTTWSSNLRKSHYSNLATVEKQLSSDEFRTFKNRINQTLAKEKDKVQKSHDSKLKRDSDLIKCCYVDIKEQTKVAKIKRNVKNRRKAKRIKTSGSGRKRHCAIRGTLPSIDNIPTETLNKCVINLSKTVKDLTPHQLYLFYLGKSFAPTPPLPDYSRFRQDVLQFAYKLRWTWFWFNNTQRKKPLTEKQAAINKVERSLLKPTETKYIKATNNHCLELYIEKVSNDLLQSDSSTISKLPDNLTKESRKALEEMKTWNDVVIRPADKGSRYFLLDRSDYVERVQHHLYDTQTFEKTERTQAELKTKQAILNWIELYRHTEEGLTDKIVNWITPDDICKPGNNYVNLKAHKPEQNYPGRMISTGCASAIKNLSALTAHELTKVSLPHVIQDVNHFLRKVDEINESGVLLNKSVIHVSLDIESMFPSISKEVGLEECKLHLNKRSDPIFSTKSIIDALEITLDNNITVFENETFRQVKGTAMGPKNACAYADTTIHKIDCEVMEGQWSHPPILWARFRDDVYIPWTHGPELLEIFLKWLNTRIPGIKFTIKFSKHGVVFLQTFVYTKNGILHTKPFSKPCDDHSYNVPSSCHPTHTLRNIPYNVALSIYKFSSETSEYNKSKTEYSQYLKARGYSNCKIQEDFRKVESRERKEYYQKPEKKLSDLDGDIRVTPLVTDFNPGLPNIGRILNKHKHILKLDPVLMKAVQPDGIFASFRGAKTLHDILVHSKLRPSEEAVILPTRNSQETPGGCSPCAKKCDLCKFYLKETSTAYSFHTNKIFNIQQKLDCNSDYVIYVINDIKCRISSVGFTTYAMRVRFRNHKSHIKMYRNNCVVSSHFTDNEILHPLDRTSIQSFSNSLPGHIEVIIIEKVDLSNIDPNDLESKIKACKKREIYWQNQLKTLKQYGGMNIREENL